NPFKGNVDHFNIEVDGQTENVVGASGATIPETPHDDSDDFVAFTVGGNDTSFTAGEQDVDIVAGEILAQIGTSLVGDLPATCTPDGDNVIATVKVEEDEESEDTIAPVISLNGDNPMELEVGSTYDEPGATAEDDVDGDVSDAIEVSGDLDTYIVDDLEIFGTILVGELKETCKRNSDNVIVTDNVEEDEESEDTIAPVISLNGDNPMELEVGSTYDEPGA